MNNSTGDITQKDATATLAPMSCADVTRLTLFYARQGNSDKLAQLLTSLNQPYYTGQETSAFSQALLDNDYAELAYTLLDAHIIDEWVTENTRHIIQSCPRIFDKWVQPRSYIVQSLGEAFEHWEDSSKIALLRGELLSKPHRCLHNYLRTNPSFWAELSPQWIGSKDSSLRQAAIDLGWTPQALIGMAPSFFAANRKDAWCQCVDYPYSLAMAVALHTQASRGRRRVSINIWRTQCRPDACPVDVALATIILRHIDPAHSIDKDPCTPVPDAATLADLERLMDVHVALHDMEGLMLSLANNRLPGTVSENEVRLHLPDLELEKS